jgi:hypothetical protein
MDSKTMTIDRRWVLKGIAGFGAGAALAVGGQIGRATGQEATPSAPFVEEVAFQQQMRKLWEDHITWTRLYIVSFAADLPDQDPTAQRLLQNQVDIGDAVKPFYGEEAGDDLTALLKEHIQGAVDVLKAAKAGDQAALDGANQKWYANADDIATFLNKANPDNRPLADLKAQMKMHLDLTLQEARDRLKGDYEADIKDYDKVHDYILQLADVLSAGIIAQFPEKFA